MAMKKGTIVGPRDNSGAAAVFSKVRSNPNISQKALARRVRGFGLSPKSLTLYAGLARVFLKA